MAQELSGATADIKDPPRLGLQLPGKAQGGLLDGDEQEPPQRAVLVAARPPVEPARRGMGSLMVAPLVLARPTGAPATEW